MARETKTGSKDGSWVQAFIRAFSHSVAFGPMGDGSFPVPKERGVPCVLSIPQLGRGALGHIASGHTGTDPTHLPS